MSKSKDNIMVKGEKTILIRANNSSYSLRTTVPKGIVSHLELKEGDTLIWKLSPSKDGKEFVIIVEPENKLNEKVKK